jgi:hypothetical protein
MNLSLDGKFDEAAQKLNTLCDVNLSDTLLLLPILERSIYRLIIVDSFQKRVSVFDTRINSSLPINNHNIPDDYIEDCQRLFNTVRSLITTALNIENFGEYFKNFPDYVFPSFCEGVRYFEALPQDNITDSSVYVLTAIDYIINDVPLIFRINQIEHLRKLLAHQLLLEKAPI